MAFDACGTTKLEGDEILKRLADYLNVDKQDLKSALLIVVAEVKGDREYLADKNRERNV